MKIVSGSLKLAYSQYRELQAFAQFGSDLDDDTKERLAQGERIVEVLKQDRNAPVKVELQVVIIYAVINDLLKDIEIKDIAEFQNTLFAYIENSEPSIIDEIAKTGDLTKETEMKIVNAVGACKKSFLSSK